LGKTSRNLELEEENKMPRGQYVRKSRLAIVPREIQGIIPETAFTEWSGWDKLSGDEQKIVINEGKLLAQALLQYGNSKIAIGEHLTKLQGILEPHNLFGRFLKNFHFSKRTAYRYISGFQNAKGLLPEPILKAAMARGVNILGDSTEKPLGVYTDAVEKLPPPREANAEQANTWLNKLEEVRKETRSTGAAFTMEVPQDPQTLLKECYRFVHLRYRRLPNNHKVRQSWVHKLTGMILADLGVSGPQTFTPMAVPEDFKAQRGRPTQVATPA
jgi:hypothetical protein